MKTIEVVAAVIKDGNKILATQRGYGDFKGLWEFPGGKIESGEDNKSALVREIKEELNVDIIVGNHIHTVEYDYPNFHLTMHCYFASISNGTIELIEHQEAKWLTKDTLDSVTWLEADIDLVNILKHKL